MRIHLLLALLTTLLPYGECMPNTLTGTATYHTTTNVPAAGDARSAASVDGAFQDLLDNDTYLNTRLLGDGIVLWRGSLASIPSTNHIAIGAIDQVIVGGKSFHGNPTTFDAATVTASTRYYIYCYDNSGSLAYEKSTTAPDSNLYFKTGDTTRVYLGTFLGASSGGGIVSFYAKRGVYSYRESDVANNDTRVLAGGTSTSYAAVPAVPIVPASARKVWITVLGTTLANSQIGAIRTTGDSGDTRVFSVPNPSVNTDVSPEVQAYPIQLDTSNRLDYKVTASASLDIIVTGFEE